MFKDLSNALALISPAQSGSQADYSNVSPDQILNDPFFRNDVIENARGQGMVDFSFEEALSEWYNEQSYAELNEIGAVFGDAGYLKTEGLQGDARERMGRLTAAYQRMPNVLTTAADGGSISDQLSGADITKTLAGANLANPSNFVGGGSAKAAAYGALAVGKTTGKAAYEAGKAGAKSQFVAGAASEGVISVAGQNRDINLGNRDEFSFLEAGKDIGVGAFANYGISFLIGAALTPLAKAKLRKNKAELESRGFTQNDIDEAATTGGAAGIDELLTYESKADLEAQLALDNPVAPDAEGEIPTVPTIVTRESVDIDLEQINSTRSSVDAEIQDIDNPPTAARRKELDAEAKLLQALQDEASDVNRIYLEIDDLNARIKEGLSPEDSVKTRAKADKLMAEARSKKGDFNIRKAIYQRSGADGYIEALDNYKKAVAEAEQKAAQARAAEAEVDVPEVEQPAARVETKAAAPQVQPEQPTQKTPIQQEAVDAETQAELDEAEDFDQLLADDAPEATVPEAPVQAAQPAQPAQPAPVQVIQPEAAPVDPIEAAIAQSIKEDGPFPVEAKPDVVKADGTTKPAPKPKPVFSPRAKKFAQIALGVDENLDLEKISKSERNRISREILTAIDGDNISDWKDLNLAGKIARIDEIMEVNAQKAIPEVAATPAPVIVVPTEAATPAPVKAVEPEVAEPKASGDPEAIEFKKAFDLESTKPFDLPENLATFASEQADPEASIRLATLFSSIVETGSEVVLGDKKLMKSVMQGIFGLKDGKAIYREYLKVHQEAFKDLDGYAPTVSKMSKADSNFERKFINDYISARKARVTSEVKSKFTGYWDNKSNHYVISDLTEKHTKAWRADAQEILRSQYNLRGASLAHWEMFSDIKPSKKASEAYIKSALRGELPESKRQQLTEGVVLSQDMAVTHANKTQRPVAFLTTRSIGAKYALTEGYPVKSYKNGRHYIPAGQIVFYSPYDNKFYQSTRELLQANNRISPEQRDTFDVAEYVDINDFRDRDKILGTGFQALLARYKTIHNTKNIKDPVTGEKVITKVPDYQRIGEMKEFIVSRFLLQQEIQNQSTDTFFSLAQKKTEQVDAPATPAKKTTPRKKSEGTVEEPIIPPRQRLALLSKDGESIRVITDAQLERGDGINVLLGKADISDFEVGFVPMDSPKSSDLTFGLLVDLYQKNTDQPVRKMFTDHAPNIKDLANFKAKDFLSDEEFEFIYDGYKKWLEPDITRADRTMDEIVFMIQGIDSKTRIKDGEFDSAFDGITKLLEIQKKYFPQGVGRTTEKRGNSIAHARRVLAGYEPDEKVNAGTLLKELGKGNYDAVSKLMLAIRGAVDVVNPRMGAPVVGKNQNSDISGSLIAYPDGKNEIKVNSKENVYPKFAVLIHEVAHWSYQNAMTPEMRLEFWNSIKEAVYTDGKVDPDKLANTTGHVADSSDDYIERLGLDGSSFSAQEYFANAFTKWAMRERHADMANTSYWQKVSSFVFSLMEKLQGKESGDPKLDAIFAQLYPENTAANRQAKKYVKIYSTSNPPKHVIEAESTAQFVMRQRLDELKGVWDTFSYNLTSNGLPAGEFSGTIVNNARKLSRTLNSLSMTRGESRRLSSQGLDNDPILGPSGTNTTKGGALGPLADKGYAKKMRVLAKEINTIVTQNLSGDAGQTVLPKERFDYDKFNELYDDFSETNILTDEADEFFSMAAEIAEVKDGDINGIFQFIDQNQVSEVDFDSGLTLQMYDADPLGHMEAAEQLTELISSNKDLIDGAAQVLADNYYQYSREGYALAVPSDNILKLYSITGNKQDIPLSKEAAIVKGKYSKKAKKFKGATNALPKAGYRSLEGLSGQEFAAKHQEALDSGDKDAINNVYFEAYRRGTADSIHHLSGDAAIKSGQVQSAIDMENVTKIDSDGVWADAPLTIRDSTKMMTHRDPEVQANMRLMFQRMYGLINASTRSIVDDVPLMDTYTLGKISGENLSDSYGAVRDFSTAKFGSLRSDLRRIAIGLDRETSDPKALMHEIGHVLKRALPHEDLLVIQDAYKMAIKAKDPVATEFASQYKTSTNSDQAEEWFVESWANYLANRVSKEEIITDYSGDGLMSNDLLVVKGKLGQYLDMMSEYAMYGLNGLIGRNDVKQMFRRLTFSGNLVQRQTILGNMSNHYIPSSYLKDSAQQAIKDMPTDGQRNLRNFVQGSITGIGGRIAPLYYATTGRILDKVVPDNFMGKNRLSGAIYVATTPETAAKVFTDPKSKARPYNRKEVVDAVTRLSELNGEDANEMTQFVLDEIYLLENLVDKRHRMINDSMMAKSAMEDPSMSDRKVKNTIAYKELTEEIESLNDNITEIVEYFEVKVGISPIEHNAVVVSSIKPNEVLSFSAETPINDKNTGVYKDLLAIMTPTMKEADYRLLSGKLDSAITAAHAFDVLSSVSGSSTSLPRALKELNFKAAKVTTDDGDDVIALMVPQQVKKLNETEFTNPEVIPVINETATLSTVTGEMMLHVDSLEKKVDVNPSAVAQAIASMVERNGSNSAAADTISQMTRGYVGQGETAKKFLGGVKNTFSTLLSENSVQIREGGMGWLGNLIKPENGVGHYEKHGSRVGKKVMPIIKLIQDINGPEKGTGRRYMDRVNQWGYKPSQGEARVLKAMRRPVGNDFEKRLKGDERRLYDMLRAQFKGELEEMRGLGVLIGNIKNYIPQVWDVNMINKSKETQLQFKTSLSSYFVSEARNRGDVLPLGEAEKRAGKMLARLTDDDGVYIPSRHVNQTGSKTDHLDFSRVVRLDEFPEHLDDLEGFLVNDLGGITTKYFNESSRRILLTKDFGLESHGFYDYMQTHENGLKGAAQLLSSGKVQRRSIESRDGEDVTVLEHQLFMPIARNEAHGMEIMKVAMDILETQGMPAAKEHLMSLALKRQPALERRVDSILTALSETGGATSSTVTDYKHAFGMFDTLRGRSASRGGTYDEGARRFSKNARMFNSVSLLSYTVVTSMTDLVLPIIRTGSISSAMKGLAKVNADPDYREAIRNVGTGMASIAHNKLVHMSGSEGDKLSNAFFSGIGLNQWTEYMRDYAASTAYEAIKAEQRIAIRSMRGDGTDMSKQGADFRRAKRFLARVGLGNFAERGAQSLDSVKLLENDQVREAIHRMTNEAVFAPNGNDIPLIWQSPLGSMLFQFKSFPLMMGRLARMALWDNVGKPMLTKGEPVSIAPAAMLLTLAPLFGEQVLSLRDTITAKGGEEGGEYKRRERSANKFLETFGMDEDDPVFESEQMDALAGRYVEGFMYAGGFGLLADLFHQSAEQVDNGAYGQNRIMSTFLGPTAGAIFGTGVNVVAGAVDGNDDSNSKERQAWREVIGRIPLVGQNRQIKEDAVDYLGGAATR